MVEPTQSTSGIQVIQQQARVQEAVASTSGTHVIPGDDPREEEQSNPLEVAVTYLDSDDMEDSHQQRPPGGEDAVVIGGSSHHEQGNRRRESTSVVEGILHAVTESVVQPQSVEDTHTLAVALAAMETRILQEQKSLADRNDKRAANRHNDTATNMFGILTAFMMAVGELKVVSPDLVDMCLKCYQGLEARICEDDDPANRKTAPTFPVPCLKWFNIDFFFSRPERTEWMLARIWDSGLKMVTGRVPTAKEGNLAIGVILRAIFSMDLRKQLTHSKTGGELE